METTALNPRQSLMNRTIIITKKSARRPILMPEALTVPPNNGQMIDQNVEKNLHLKNGKFIESCADFVEFERILRENLVADQIAEQILELANQKAKQWDELVEKYEKDKLMERQFFELKLNVANQNSEKATELFKILAENGIDIDAILSDRSADSIRRHLQFPTSPLCANDEDLTNSANHSETESKLVRENYALNGEINSLEDNYSNLFKLYEKMRLNCVNLKEVQQSLNTQLEQADRKYGALHKMYMELLVEAQKKLKDANDALRNAETEHEQKTLSIRMALKRAQIRIGSLETALELKNKENAELHSICDQLIEAREQLDKDNDSSNHVEGNERQ
ncbi:hypothetical protein niasHS_000778 [Heterodera schachtii]|uniref:Transforming acidic coiled-coil-containing protein C-terminal domain-containing protein n=1 Tax=Heterodera schachtii TaxID=97005 RepID=A0ABD2KJK4_HETSC